MNPWRLLVCLISAALYFVYIWIYLKYLKNTDQPFQKQIWWMVFLTGTLFVITSVVPFYTLANLILFILTNFSWLAVHWHYCWGILVRSYEIECFIERRLYYPERCLRRINLTYRAFNTVICLVFIIVSIVY